MSSIVPKSSFVSATRPSLLSAKLQRTARYSHSSQRQSLRIQCRSASGGPEDPRQTDFLQQCRIEANRFTEVEHVGPATNFSTPFSFTWMLNFLLCKPAAIRHIEYWRRRTGLHQLLLVTVIVTFKCDATNCHRAASSSTLYAALFDSFCCKHRGQDPIEALWITFCATIVGLVCPLSN